MKDIDVEVGSIVNEFIVWRRKNRHRENGGI